MPLLGSAIPAAAAGARPRASFVRRALPAIVVAASNAQRHLVTHGVRALGPARAYRLMAGLARRFYRLADEVRLASEQRCRLALGAARTEGEIQAIAQDAFVHRMWNLVDLMLAPRLLRPTTYARYGGQIPEPYRAVLLDAQRRRQPVILLTAYCGPYDLLPVFLGLNGISATAVYRPHPNRDFDRYRQAVRTSAGCAMVESAGAAAGLAEALAAGRTVALLADRAAGRTGVPVSFLGEETRAPRSVGWLAERYGAIVAVTAIRRRAEPFRFALEVADLFAPDAWRAQADPIAYSTRRYVAALERLVRARPEQYLWLHRREPGAAESARSPGARMIHAESPKPGAVRTTENGASRCSPLPGS